MNKHYLLLILAVLLIPLSAAQEDFLSTHKLRLSVNISSDMELAPSSSDYKIDYILADLSFFPREDDIQRVISLTTEPEAQSGNNSLIYEWENLFNDLSFLIKSEIETRNRFRTVDKKIEFPLRNLPEEIVPYTLPSDNIDSDDNNIIILSSSLAEGEDDLYIVVNKLANWVKISVKYSLDTLTAEVSQKASWVMNAREGVCDEITTLFIAMTRSVGIPARYISGVAYTNWKGMNDFGHHAWAEVYFPGYGWLPFDITYNQMGFIDPGHIKLKESIDSNEPSTEYEWKGVDIDIKTQGLNIETKVLERIGKIDPLFLIEARVLKSSIGFGSYNLIEAEITNLNNFYLTTELSVSKTNEITVFEESKKNIVLKPNEKKKVYWVIRLRENLDSHYTYTFPIQVYSLRNVTSKANFTSTINEPVFTFKEINSLKEEIEEEAVKKYSKKLSLNCTTEKNEYYIYEIASINCRIENLGNVLLTDLEACLKEDCKTIDLGITQAKKISFNLSFISPGKKEVKFIVKNNQVSKAIYLKFGVLDKPVVKISGMEFPDNVLFDQDFSINFELEKHSASNPKDVEVKLTQGNFFKVWNINELHNNQRFIVDMTGKILNIGENKFKLSVNYKDGNNGKYNETAEFTIQLTNVTSIQKLQIILTQMLQKIGNLFR